MLFSTSNGMCFAPSISPDTRKIAYTRTTFVDIGWWTNYILPTIEDVSIDRFQIVISDLSTNEHNVVAYGMIPSWSPDGKQIAYSSFDGTFWHLFLYDISSGKNTQLTHSEHSDFYPSWSPDAKWIAFARLNHKRRTSDIWLVQANGFSEIQITDTPEYDEGGPCWVADGIYIHGDTGENTQYHIAFIPKSMLPDVSSAVIRTTQKGILEIEVLNSTKISGMAAKAAKLLEMRGYKVANVANSKNERNLSIGKIYFHPGYEEDAAEVEKIVPGTQELIESKSFKYPITVVLGKNTKL